GGGDRRPPPGRDRPATARRGPRHAGGARGQREARALLQDRHPILDGPDRGDGPPEDGLPGSAQPRRDRGRSRDHPALPRHGKRDPASVRYADPRLRSITESTYGCCIYQEQLMEIAKQMAGFSPAQADDLRKAVGKKKRDLMAQMKDKFLAGLAESGTDTRVAQDLWSLMTAAADYSFNRSHAA